MSANKKYSVRKDAITVMFGYFERDYKNLNK